MRKLYRNRRGVTPVLSSLLLTVIAVAGMSLAVGATYVITGSLHDNMGERLIVEDVWFNSNEVWLYLRNVGKVSVNVASVYIKRVDRSFEALRLDQNEHGWLKVTYSWSAGSVYEIKVVTGRGTIVVDYYKSPF